MRRREFLGVLGGAAALPLAARAQQTGKAPLVGVLIPLERGDKEGELRRNTFQKGLEEFGWTNGQNIRIEYRWVGTNRDHIRDSASELVGLNSDVILVSSVSVLAVKAATATIPIVF